MIPGDSAATSSGLSCLRLRAGAHTVDFVHGSTRCSELVVTFEHMSFGDEPRDLTRDGWGARWLHGQGFSVLSVKPDDNDWYRDPNLCELFEQLSANNSFRPFRSVVFYGGSMGGFAALAFSAAAPGSIVIAVNPQSTLDPEKVPWEPRFREGRTRDWNLPFADGAESVRLATRAYVIYDPHHPLDRAHAVRLEGSAVRHLHLPFVGHGIPAMLSKMGVLQEVFHRAVDDRLSSETFSLLAKRRKGTGNFWFVLGRQAKRVSAREAIFRRGIAVDPRFPGCYTELAHTLLSHGDFRSAELTIRCGLRLFPFNAGALGALADILFAAGRYDEAFDPATRALSRQPSNPQHQLRLARIYRALGQIELAQAHAEHCITLADHLAGVAGDAQRFLACLRS